MCIPLVDWSHSWTPHSFSQILREHKESVVRFIKNKNKWPILYYQIKNVYKSIIVTQLTNTTQPLIAIVAEADVACTHMSVSFLVAGSISTDCLIKHTYVYNGNNINERKGGNKEKGFSVFPGPLKCLPVSQKLLGVAQIYECMDGTKTQIEYWLFYLL